MAFSGGGKHKPDSTNTLYAPRWKMRLGVSSCKPDLILFPLQPSPVRGFRHKRCLAWLASSVTGFF